MLDRFVGHEYNCFLVGYLGYNQIGIDLEDKEKTTFTWDIDLYGIFSFRIGASFDNCLENLESILLICEENNLVLN